LRRSFCGLCYGFGLCSSADSSISADRLSSPAVALGSSLSQYRSVDFLDNTHLMIIPASLFVFMNYSEIGYTHKLDRTTVTVEAPSMLATSTIPVSAGASSSTWAATGSTAPVVAGALASLLPSTLAAHQRQSPAVPHPARLLQRWGQDCGSSQMLLPPCPKCPLLPDPRGQTMEYPVTTQDSTVSMQYSMLSTRLHYSRNSPPGRLIR
jgi:hypothetical protein